MYLSELVKEIYYSDIMKFVFLNLLIFETWI